MMCKKFSSFCILLIISLVIISCKKEEGNEEGPYGSIIFSFVHKVDGTPMEVDNMQYANEAGNQYMVNEIQYFISNVTLHRTDSSTFLIDDFQDIYYVDTDLEETFTWLVFDHIPEGDYSSISFTFGIGEDKNHSLMFVNPPESFMFWPEFLGGGYHYMKLNGKWLNLEQQVSPFNFHLGIGQVYDSTGQIAGFIHNNFEVKIPESSFHITDRQWTEIDIIMNVEKWFKSPNMYDHNVWGGDIMQKQEAMRQACENGHNVFTAKVLD